MDNQMRKTSDEIRQLTDDSMAGLVSIWMELFDSDIVRQNLVKLVGHVNQFYQEICEETAQRKETIQKKIESLEKEHQTLTTLLKCRPLAMAPPVDQPLFTYQRSLDQQLQDLRDKVDERKERIVSIERREVELCQMLDSPVKGLQHHAGNRLPSEEELENFEFYVHEMQVKYDNRCEEVANIKQQIQAIADEIELDVSRSSLMSQTIRMSDSNIDELRSFLEQVRADKLNIKSEINDKWTALQSLYDCLDTSSMSRLGSTQPLTKTTVNKLNAEIVRCEKIKRQNIKRIIEKVRVQIEEYWERNMMSDKERARFSNFTNDCYTEDLLMLHEMELNDLKQFYSVNMEIFEKYKLHMELWDRAIALESRENDPNRYKNRGGNLLMEEKERRTVAQRLAKLRTELERMAGEYESEKRRPFSIRGANMIESINDLYVSRRLAKEQQMSARKATTTNRMGPPNSILATTTMSAPRSMVGSGRTPISTTRLDNRSGTLKRSASNTKLNFPMSASKKPKIIVTTPSKQTIKRSILSELTAAITPNCSQPKFRKPAARKPAKVIDTLTINGARRKSSHSRRSHNRSAKTTKPSIAVTNGESTDSSYVQFAEEMTVRSVRSSIKPKVSRAVKARPLTPRRLDAPSSLNVMAPLTSCRSSPRAKPLQRTINTPSPGLKRLPEFF